MEKLCLDAGGPEALAFKMVRDAMLLPVHDADSDSKGGRPPAAVSDLPTIDPALTKEYRRLPVAKQVDLVNVASDMRTMLDPFHNTGVCEDGTGRFPAGSVTGVLSGKTEVFAVGPRGSDGEMDVRHPECVINVAPEGGSALRGAVQFHEKSVAMDDTFLKLSGATCPALKRELKKFKK